MDEDLDRRAWKAVAYPPLSHIGPDLRRELQEALIEAESFEDLPGKWQAAFLESEANAGPQRDRRRVAMPLPWRGLSGDTAQAMSEDQPQVVRKMFAATARGISGAPLEDLYEVLDPDVEWIPLNAPLDGTRYRGHEGVRRWIHEMSRDWEDFEARPEEFVDLGNERLLALGTWRARGRISGVRLDSQPAAWLIQLRSGKTLRMQTFTDRAEAFKAAGLSE